jgi:hypothetical protein
VRRALLVGLAIATAVVVAATSGAAAAGDWLGAEACGRCHAAAFASWQKSAHARATASLGKHAGDGACLPCHATGEASARLPGVQCEACHGAGAAYAEDDIMRDAVLARALGLRDLAREPALGCGRCHRPGEGTRLAPFDAKAAWKTIAHQ